jgi:tetratricopeptide (TPR) repeat protein
MSLMLALLLQVGPDPLRGGLPGDDLMQDRPPRAEQAESEPAAQSRWLADCFAQIEADPARAHTMAQIRRNETTGADRVLANHCLGTAASALGLWQDARAAYREARDETPADETRARARFAALAGNAALAGGDADGALALLTLAETDARTAGSAPLEALAAIDRARALVALGRQDEAVGALALATSRAPESSEAWLLTATLLRRLERLGEAQTAIERAAALAPRDPDIGLEAGVIALFSERPEAARSSWQSVLALAPESHAAATARDYLAQLGEARESDVTPPEEEPQP